MKYMSNPQAPTIEPPRFPETMWVVRFGFRLQHARRFYTEGAARRCYKEVTR